MKTKITALFIAILIINLPIAIGVILGPDGKPLGTREYPSDWQPPKQNVTEKENLCGNNVINVDEECELPYSISKIINPQQCIDKYKTTNPDKTNEQVKNIFNIYKVSCNNECECKTITNKTIVKNSENTPSCGNYNLEQRELCDPTATNGASRCEENWIDEIRISKLTKQEIQNKLNRIDHFECSYDCQTCKSIFKEKSVAPIEPLTPVPDKNRLEPGCGNNVLDRGEMCDPTVEGAVERCEKRFRRDFEIQGRASMIDNLINFRCDDILCTCSADLKQKYINNCKEIMERIQNKLDEEFNAAKIHKPGNEIYIENLKQNCLNREAWKQWIKDLAEENKNCFLASHFFDQIDEACAKLQIKMESENIGLMQGIKRAVSYITPRWLKRFLNWSGLKNKCGDFSAGPFEDNDNFGLGENNKCQYIGQACIIGPRFSDITVVPATPQGPARIGLALWNLVKSLWRGGVAIGEGEYFQGGKCDNRCICMQDDDVQQAINEIVERLKEENSNMLIN